MSSKDRVLEYMALKGISKREFYLATGLSNGFLDKTNNIGADKLERIISAYSDINLQYVVAGTGEVVIKEKMGSNLGSNVGPKSKNYDEREQIVHSFNEPQTDYKKIPLLTVDAIAGWGTGDFPVQDTEVDKYVVPEFKDVDFLIRVKGSSMYPKYSSGDIVACKYVKDSLFIQWGKAYVIDSTQGALVKRLFQSAKEECIECRSDNNSYPPFDIPKSEIRAMALVVGVIRLE